MIENLIDFIKFFFVCILYFHILSSLKTFSIKSKLKNFSFYKEENSLGSLRILKILFKDYLLLLLDINQLRGIAVTKSNIKYDSKYFITIYFLSCIIISSS